MGEIVGLAIETHCEFKKSIAREYFESLVIAVVFLSLFAGDGNIFAQTRKAASGPEATGATACSQCL